MEKEMFCRDSFCSKILKKSERPVSWYSLKEIERVSRQPLVISDWESLISPESSIILLEMSSFSKAMLQLRPSLI